MQSVVQASLGGYSSAWNDSAVIARWKGRTINRRQFFADAAALSEQLPEAGVVINLCADRYHFSVGFVAAVSRGQTNLLPADRSWHSIAEALTKHPQSYCLGDTDELTGNNPLVRIDNLLPFKLTRPSRPIDTDTIAALSYTSGSTGQPKTSEKSWSVFIDGADAALNQLDLRERRWHIVSTVPPQHMYGLETSLFWPLRSRLSWDGGQPFFPEDINSAITSIDRPCLLVSTPLHLKACINSGIAWRNVAMVLSSTAPLSVALAARIEERFKAPVQEIFGSTETLSFATRRPTVATAWTPYAGSKLFVDKGCSYLNAPFLRKVVALDDHVEVAQSSQFKVIGRRTDLLKVAGKRASLSRLNTILTGIDGIEDGLFFAPDVADESIRLSALVVSSLAKRDILEALRNAIDEVFLPRPLYYVAKIPRSEIGKLDQRGVARLIEELTRGREL